MLRSRPAALMAALILTATLQGLRPSASLGSNMNPLYPWAAKEFTIIKHDGFFHLIYMRRNLDDGQQWFQDYGHATSANLSTWEQQPPILPVRPDKWDNNAMWAPHLIKIGNTFCLFYTAVTHDPPNWDYHQRIGLATSTDLFNWTRYDQPAIECTDIPWTYCDPTLAVGGDFRDPFVMEDPAAPGEYLLYYVARSGADHDQFLGGVARSTGDMMQWTDAGSMTNTHRSKTSSYIVESTHLIRHGGRWFFFYTNNLFHPVAFQTSTDPLGATMSWGPQRTVDEEVFPINTQAWFGSETFSDNGKDYFAAVDSDPFSIEFREIAWGADSTFTFIEPQILDSTPTTPPSSWQLELARYRPDSEQLSFSISAPHAGDVTLAIIDIAGRVRRTVFSGRVGPGQTSVVWDGRDHEGHSLSSGVYFASLRGAGVSLSRTVARIR